MNRFVRFTFPRFANSLERLRMLHIRLERLRMLHILLERLRMRHILLERLRMRHIRDHWFSLQATKNGVRFVQISSCKRRQQPQTNARSRNLTRAFVIVFWSFRFRALTFPLDIREQPSSLRIISPERSIRRFLVVLESGKIG